MKKNALLNVRFFLGLLLVALMSVQCRPITRKSELPTTATFGSDWSLAELKNTTYRGVDVHPGPVTLSDGRWEGEPYVGGGSSRPSIQFVRDFYRTGRLISTSMDAAVVFLSENTGGSGAFLYLAVVEKKNGTLVNTATAPVGDRVQIRELQFENGSIVLDVLQDGPTDAACCPGELATRRWQMVSGKLEELDASLETDRLSLDVIADTTWVLRAWRYDEPAPDQPTISLVYDQGRLAGSAGCNRYFASVKVGSSPGDFQAGPSGTTRMICPEPVMVVEQRFLKQLGGVRKFGFMAGQLSLTFESDGQWGVMLFDRATDAP